METNRTMRTLPHRSPAPQTEEGGSRDIEIEPIDFPEETAPVPFENLWRPISEAPKDKIIEGRFSTSEEDGRPIRWRHTRRRIGPYRWEDTGVWHAAETAGAVELRPIEWREWMPAGLHFGTSDADAA